MKKKKRSVFATAFGRRLRLLRAQAALTQEALAALTSGAASQDTITRLERGAATAIGFGVLEELLFVAHKEGITADELLCGRNPIETASREDLAAALSHHVMAELVLTKHPAMVLQTRNLTPSERRLVILQQFLADAEETLPKAARQSNEQRDRKAAAKTVAQSGIATEMGPQSQWTVRLVEAGFREVHVEGLPDDWRGKYVPILGRLSAGEGVDTVEAEETPPGWAASYLIYEGAPASAFALRVVGHSMEPEHQDGDVVVVDGAQPVRSGLCCVIYDRDGDRIARLKRLRIRGGKAYLQSRHADYSTITVPAAGVEAYRLIDHLPRIAERPDRTAPEPG